MAIRVSAFEIVKESNNPLLSTHRTWQRIQLCEIAHVQNGYAFNSMHFNNNQKGVPIVRIRDVGKDGTETYYDGPFEKEYIVNKGDILVGMDGDFRCAEWRSTECLLNQRVCRIIPKTSNFNRKFLLICLQPYLDEIHKETSAVTVKHLSSVTISEIPLPLPPLPEQHRIVAKIEELFSDLDEGIASLKKAKEQLKIYRQSVLKWAFEGKLTEEWRKKNKPEPASELLKRIKEEREKKYKDECAKAKKEGTRNPPKTEFYPQLEIEELMDMNSLPNGWQWEKAGNLFDSIVPNRDKPKTFSGNIPWITIPNLCEYSISIDYSKIPQGLTDTEIAEYNARTIPLNSVIMTCIGRFGISATVDRLIVINQQLHAFITTSNFYPAYLAYAIQNQRKYFEKVATSTTIAYVNKTNCNSVPIPVCSYSEQLAIVEQIESRLSVADNLEKTIDESLSKADALRQSILKQAFEGKLVPQDPNDEPAEKLLERIKKEKSVNDTEQKPKAKGKRKAAISA